LRRVQGALARSGDADAAEDVTSQADSAVPPVPVTPAIPATPPTEAGPVIAGRGPRPGRHTLRNESCDDDDDIRIAALNAVLQMDPDRAVPLLKTVLARRDEGSACLRRKAVFLLSQKRTDETSSLLLSAVRSDPDREVREQAVFWLSQVPGDETAIALDSILRDPKTDPEIQEKAIFALSQHRGTRAVATLRAFAERSEDAAIDKLFHIGKNDPDRELRKKAIFWIGQSRSPRAAQYLQELINQ